MKFRSVLYVFIAVFSLVLQVVLAKYYGGVGCAIAISGALIVGQILVMNVYYQKKQGLDIASFWKEICKMSIVPVVLVTMSMLLLHYSVHITTWFSLIVGILVYSVVYIPSFYCLSMNNEERNLFTSVVKKVIRRA